MKTTTSARVHDDIIHAIDAGIPLTDEQTRELLAFEAARIGLSFDEAIEQARDGTLPKNAIGFGLEFLARSISQ
jgi:hypothetical protein